MVPNGVPQQDHPSSAREGLSSQPTLEASYEVRNPRPLARGSAGCLKSDTGFELDGPRRIVEQTRRPLWGHLGVLLPGHTHSRWYPIDQHEHDKLAAAILEATPEHPWIHALTLNNRVLVVNALAI